MPKKRVAKNPNNIDDKTGEDMGKGAIPGNPVRAKDVEVEEIKVQEILMTTPKGRLDKKTYQIFNKVVIKPDGTKATKGRYRKLIKIEKGVRG